MAHSGLALQLNHYRLTTAHILYHMPDHPGLLHLYVHLMEMSPFPQRAIRAGDRLREIAPDAGHLIHMPTHIDVLCGNYHDVLVYNQRAIMADRKYLERAGALNVYSLYRTHNHHFAIYGAMFLGQFTPALKAAQELIDTTPEELLRLPSPPMADFIEVGAVERLLGNAAPGKVMSSTKSMTGHLLGAAGALEAAFAILAIRDQVAPPTINLDNPDGETVLDLVPHKAKPMKIEVAMSNSFGFGGTNASVIFKTYA